MKSKDVHLALEYRPTPGLDGTGILGFAPPDAKDQDEMISGVTVTKETIGPYLAAFGLLATAALVLQASVDNRRVKVVLDIENIPTVLSKLAS